jgi:hypothetical protein
MPYFSTDIDIDVYEFVSSCSRKEIKNLIDVLVEDGHLPELILNNGTNNTLGYHESEFIEKLTKLGTKYYSLSKEDEETLEKIFKKYA